MTVFSQKSLYFINWQIKLVHGSPCTALQTLSFSLCIRVTWKNHVLKQYLKHLFEIHRGKRVLSAKSRQSMKDHNINFSLLLKYENRSKTFKGCCILLLTSLSSPGLNKFSCYNQSNTSHLNTKNKGERRMKECQRKQCNWQRTLSQYIQKS